jgi:hypothetical protein
VARESLHRDGIRCDGTQPWEDQKSDDACDYRLIAVQRGATSNYIAERLSALDIPEERPRSAEKKDQIRSHIYFEKVVADNGGPQAEMVSSWIADELGVLAEEVLRIAAGDDDPTDAPLLDLKDGEWAAFLKKLEASRDHSVGDFIVDGWKVPADSVWPSTLTAAWSPWARCAACVRSRHFAASGATMPTPIASSRTSAPTGGESRCIRPSRCSVKASSSGSMRNGCPSGSACPKSALEPTS